METAAARMVRGQDPIRRRLRRKVRLPMTKNGLAHEIPDSPHFAGKLKPCLGNQAVVSGKVAYLAESNVLVWKGLTSRRLAERPRLPAGMRIYAVGDMHGCADLLFNLFTRIDEDLKARPTSVSVQVFLGDYIDRGPNSRQVIDLLIARRQEHDIVLLKGNHEDCALRFFNDPTMLSAWKNIGGLSTIRSYGVPPPRGDDPRSLEELAAAFNHSMPDNHRRFLQGLALSFTCGDFFFVHAGVRPGIPLHEQSEQDLLWIREDFLLHEEYFGRVIVHGHTPAREPEICPNRVNIDTGAYATGRLTCLVLEDDQMRFL
jgi:serine/threonine protein phosphatase 1